jgi:hypothetical protein
MCAYRLPPTEHERKLKEEEFAEERKSAARDAFRDRFKDAAQESGETDEQESCVAPPTMQRLYDVIRWFHSAVSLVCVTRCVHITEAYVVL